MLLYLKVCVAVFLILCIFFKLSALAYLVGVLGWYLGYHVKHRSIDHILSSHMVMKSYVMLYLKSLALIMIVFLLSYLMFNTVGLLLSSIGLLGYKFWVYGRVLLHLEV